MDLFVFAHWGEAAAFIDHFGLKKTKFIFPGVYAGNDRLALVSGEGLQNVTEKLSAVMAVNREQIENVINAGVCGTLQDGFIEYAVLSVRTVYLYSNADMQFKSFSSADTQVTVDCVSSFERIEDLKQATYLSHFGHLVDRELWAVASVCKLFNKPFYGLKCVSDFADKNIPVAEISEKSAKYSNALLEFYRQHFTSGNTMEKPVMDLQEDQFYFTVSQKRIVSGLLEKLSLKWDKPDPEIFKMKVKEIITLEKNLKKRSTQLITWLQEQLQPANTRILQEIKKELKELERIKGQVAMDYDLQFPQVNLTAILTSQRDIDKMIAALQQLNWQNIEAIYGGRERTKKS